MKSYLTMFRNRNDQQNKSHNQRDPQLKPLLSLSSESSELVPLPSYKGCGSISMNIPTSERAGFCGSSKHIGYLTQDMINTKNCIKKKCRFFIGQGFVHYRNKKRKQW